jgi:hypothetical protein
MSTGSTQPFQLAGATTISASTTAASASLPAVGDVVVVTNLADAPCYVALGQAASVGGVYSAVLRAGDRRVLACNQYVPSVSAVLASGTGSIVFEVGTGTVFG